MNAVGCHIYAGGFTVGMKRYFNVVCHLEDGTYGVETFKLNHSDIPVYTEVNEWPFWALSRSEIQVVYCNPPCAVWSSMGRNVVSRKDWRDDSRLNCVEQCFSVLEKVRPTIWIWESVCQAYVKGREFVEELTERARRLGYGTIYFLTDAALHGAPQFRRRFHCIFTKVQIEFEKPRLESLRTVRQVLHNVDGRESVVTGEWKKLYGLMKPGECGVTTRKWLKHLELPKAGFVLKKLRLDQPSNTVTGLKLVHPTESRLLTSEELKVLCTYPISYQLKGSEGARASLVARGVLPVMGRYLGRMCYLALQKYDKLRADQIQVVDFRKCVSWYK